MVGVDRLFAAVLLMIAVSGCWREPPPYESRYTPPLTVAPSQPQAPPLPPGATFVDDFERPNTNAGLDEGWDMLGAPPGKPAVSVGTGAFIRNGHYVSSDDSNVYAVQTLGGVVRRVGAEGRWTRVGDGGYETLIMGIAADDSLNQRQVQLVVTPAGWELLKRPAIGAPETVARSEFSPPLAINGTYRFEMDVDDKAVTVRVAGVEEMVPLDTIGLLGALVYWQHFSPAAELPIGSKFCVDMVWAAEEDQPLSPVPTA